MVTAVRPISWSGWRTVRGVYCYFDVNPSEISANALTAPEASGVQWHDMVTVSLGGTGTIEHIINGTGGTADSGSTVADLTSYS